jgi:hypothetical protein
VYSCNTWGAYCKYQNSYVLQSDFLNFHLFIFWHVWQIMEKYLNSLPPGISHQVVHLHCLWSYQQHSTFTFLCCGSLPCETSFIWLYNAWSSLRQQCDDSPTQAVTQINYLLKYYFNNILTIPLHKGWLCNLEAFAATEFSEIFLGRQPRPDVTCSTSCWGYLPEKISLNTSRAWCSQT